MVASVDDDASKTSMKISAGKKEGDNVVFYCQPNYDLVGEKECGPIFLQSALEVSV